jgi:hypothetical protein
MTLHAVERGEPSPTMGTYVRVMAALGLAADLALVAAGESLGLAAAEYAIAASGESRNRHAAHDMASMVLHQEAVKLLRKDPSLVGKAKATLRRWQSGGHANTMPLWDEWDRILDRQDWKRAVANTQRGQQLRQASPLPVLLPQATRLRVLAEVKAQETSSAGRQSASIRRAAA